MARPVGTPQSPETREKIRLARLGNSTITQEGRIRLSEFRKVASLGNVSARGHKKTLEGLERIAAANRCRTGSKANHWKGGLTRVSRRGRTLRAYFDWRRAVLMRDEYTCRCGATDKLTVHHIKSYREYPELRYEITNGVTLCPPCHGAVDPHYRSY